MTKTTRIAVVCTSSLFLFSVCLLRFGVQHHHNHHHHQYSSKLCYHPIIHTILIISLSMPWSLFDACTRRGRPARPTRTANRSIDSTKVQPPPPTTININASGGPRAGFSNQRLCPPPGGVYTVPCQ